MLKPQSLTGPGNNIFVCSWPLLRNCSLGKGVHETEDHLNPWSACLLCSARQLPSSAMHWDSEEAFECDSPRANMREKKHIDDLQVII